MHNQEMYCAACDAVVLFEQPPRIDQGDEHDDCPEWACSVCGEAIMLAPLTVLALNLRPHRRGHVAPQQRRAA